ncbi:MAG: glycosyl transferase [Acidobacteria bacterium]|nr:MAG: glycosyl transferase [Acidobacteriota bacterium]
MESSDRILARARTAVLIPCYNEELTIADVVGRFRAELPDAEIYVFDNNSTDRTAAEAERAGAIVLPVGQQGKGYVVRFMFQHVEADIYVMVDGDGTYPAASVHSLIAPIINNQADMAVGSRLHGQSQSQFKFLNRFGNKLFLSALNSIFKVRLTDILSGYRAFNRKLVKSLPLFGGGFEIETELTIKALERGYRIVEVPIDLSERPTGSSSKIRLVRDGMRIIHTILALFRDYKPLTFFGAMGLIVIAAGFVPGLIVVFEFIETRFISHVPSAILAVGLVISGMLLVMVGLILHTITRRFQELNYHLQALIGEHRDNRKQ